MNATKDRKEREVGNSTKDQLRNEPEPASIPPLHHCHQYQVYIIVIGYRYLYLIYYVVEDADIDADDANLTQTILKELYGPPIASVYISNIAYSLNYVRIIQPNNQEILFKLTACPPKGKMSDFRFDHPDSTAEKRHWHFKRVSASRSGLSNLTVRSEGDGEAKVKDEAALRAVWQLYSHLEDGSQLFFIKRVESML